jgi:predicted RND superfamily exporter protein
MYIKLIQKKKWCVLVVMIFLIITAFFGYMNFRVTPGSIVDDSVMDEEDIVNQGERAVDLLRSQGLKPGGAVIFSLPFLYKGEAMKRDLAYVREFTKELHRTFPRYKIFSLANLPRFRSQGEYLDTSSYINDRVLNDFDPQRWKKEVEKDPKIAGVFVAPDFTSANVILTLPRGYNEVEVSREIMEFLMDKELAWYEWYLTEDITLADQFLRSYSEEVPRELRVDQSDHQLANGKIKSVLPAGWVLGRVLMTGAFYSSLFSILGFSLGLAALVFWLSFGSWRQTGIALGCILLGLIWTRGSIGLLQQIGLEIQGKILYETVYFSLVFVSLVVSGISFTERKFDFYNETRKDHLRLSRAQVWEQTKSNPAELIDERIVVTGLVAIFGFATLYQIGIRQLLEVGFFAALGLVFLLLFTLYLLPALHVLVGGEFRMRSGSLPGKWWGLLDRLVRGCFRATCPRQGETLSSFRRKGWMTVSAVAGLVVFMVAVISFGSLGNGFKPIPVKTKPLEFIQNTLLYESSQEVNEQGMYGFDRAKFLIRAAPGKHDRPVIYQPSFLKKVDELQKTLANDLVLDSRVRYIHSVVDMASVVSRENYGHRLPQTKREAVDSFRLLRSELGMRGQEQLWCRQGLVMYVSTSATDSNNMATIVNRVLETAEKEFPGLRVDTFGKVAMYARADKYLRERKPVNAGTQLFWIFLFTSIWMGIRHWRFSRKEQKYYLSSWRSGLAISLPFIFASAMIAGVMIVFRIPLDQATACITALTVNAAIDFSLYVVADYQAGLLAGGDWTDAVRYAVLTRGRMVLVDVAINAACFAPLLLSPFIPIARLGWMMVVMLVFCGIGAMIILPAVLPLAVRRRNL